MAVSSAAMAAMILMFGIGILPTAPGRETSARNWSSTMLQASPPADGIIAAVTINDFGTSRRQLVGSCASNESFDRG